MTQFYKIGVDLGLNRSEINRIFFISGKYSLLYKILLIFVLAFIAIVIIIDIVGASRSIYPSGTLYSSVKIDDFENKK